MNTSLVYVVITAYIPSGTCTCNTYWVGDGCWTAECLNNCTFHGQCNDTVDVPFCYNCDQGWMGPDCSTPCYGIQQPMDSGQYTVEPVFRVIVMCYAAVCLHQPFQKFRNWDFVQILFFVCSYLHLTATVVVPISGCPIQG